jgi:hypothetical protein
VLLLEHIFLNIFFFIGENQCQKIFFFSPEIWKQKFWRAYCYLQKEEEARKTSEINENFLFPSGLYRRGFSSFVGHVKIKEIAFQN